MFSSTNTITLEVSEKGDLRLSSFPLNHSVYMKTSLRPYMEFFTKKFLHPLILDTNKRKAKGQFGEVTSCVALSDVVYSLFLSPQKSHLISSSCVVKFRINGPIGIIILVHKKYCID